MSCVRPLSCGKSVQCGKIENFLSLQKHNRLPQLQASNAACLNEPLEPCKFGTSHFT